MGGVIRMHPVTAFFASILLMAMGAMVPILVGPPGPAAPEPAPSPTAPAGDPNARVAVFDVNGRTVACVVIDPAGAALAMSCDFTREGS